MTWVFVAGKPLFVDGKPMFAIDPCDCCDGFSCPPCDVECPSGWANGTITVTGGCDGETIHVVLVNTSVLPDGWCNLVRGIEPIVVSEIPFVSFIETSPGVWEADIGITDCFSILFKAGAECCNLLGLEPCGEQCYDEKRVYASFSTCCCYGGRCVEGVPEIDWPESVSLTIDNFEPGKTPELLSDPRCFCDFDYVDLLASLLPGTFILAHQGGGAYLLELDIGEWTCLCDGYAPDPEDPVYDPNDCCHLVLRATANLNCDGFVAGLVRIVRRRRSNGALCTPGSDYSMEIPPEHDTEEFPPTGSPAQCHGSWCFPSATAAAGSSCWFYVSKGICASW